MLRDCSRPIMLSAKDVKALQQLVGLLKPLEYLSKFFRWKVCDHFKNYTNDKLSCHTFK